MDRIIELDLDTFGVDADRAHVEHVIGRLAPAWHAGGVPGIVNGLVLNIGWLMDPVLLWDGRPEQSLPIHSNRMAAWESKTYADLANLIESILEVAESHGVIDLRVGILVLGIGEFRTEIVRPPGTGSDDTEEGALYQERSEWIERQPHLYPFSPVVTLHGPGLDWRLPLSADPAVFASRASGIADGESFASFFADQWARFASFTHMTFLLLRDESTTPVHAGRVDFDGGTKPATLDEVNEWTESLIAATRALKLASPQTHLTLYSSGLAPTIETRFGRLDVTRVVAEGLIDGWVDQTWGGAWQDWWDAGWAGWTFQLSSLLARAALIEAGNRQRKEGPPCRHYPLIQLLDGWEPYDTLHDYPGKLKWGIWAFIHASARGERGKPIPVSGAYLAIANDRTTALIEANDFAWVLDELNAAELSRQHMDVALGPVLVVDDATFIATSSGRSEPVEDSLGFMSKWGVPALISATRSVLRGSPAVEDVVIRSGQELGSDVAAPALQIVISGVEDLDDATIDQLGLRIGSDHIPTGYTRSRPMRMRGGVRPGSWPYMAGRPIVTADGDSVAHYESAGGPTLLESSDSRLVWWDPPAVANGLDRRLTHYQIGTADPHYLAATRLHELRRGEQLVSLVPADVHQTITMQAWISAGVLHVLLCNVESGWLGDSRNPRAVTIFVPVSFTAELGKPVLRSREGVAVAVANGEATVTVPAEGMLKLELVDNAQ